MQDIGSLICAVERLKVQAKIYIKRIEELNHRIRHLEACEAQIESERAANARLTEELAELKWIYKGLCK